MLCPNCYTNNLTDAKYCVDCGELLPLTSSADESPYTKSNAPRKKRKKKLPELVIVQPGWSSRAEVLEKPEITIGRDPDNDIVIDNQFVSSFQAKLINTGDTYKIIDLDSLNGMLYKDRRVHERVLRNKDVIRIGELLGKAVTLTYMSSVIGGVYLGPHELGHPKTSIGRDPDSDIYLDDEVVSWHHAEILHTGKGYEILDKGSLNGTFVNGVRKKSTVLKNGDAILIGRFNLKYQQDSIEPFPMFGNLGLAAKSLYKEAPPFDDVIPKIKEWVQVHFLAKKPRPNRILLDHISFNVLPRQFVAIVGGSGAGKSTLLKALNASQPVSGQILLNNGDDFYKSYGAYRTAIGYVPQADILHLELTIRKALTYTARLRLPPEVSNDWIQNRIKVVLAKVRLEDKIDQPISQLSGGEKKRVSISSELLFRPSILFLDEPTSGLDPGLDKQMMELLKGIAEEEGTTVLLVTHATNNIEGRCDLVVFLSHGMLVYFGSPESAKSYFKVPDFADIYNLVETQDQAAEAAKPFRRGANSHKKSVDGNSNSSDQGNINSSTTIKRAHFRPRVFLQQFVTLTHRYWDLVIADVPSFVFRLLVTAFVGAMLLLIASPKSLVGDTAEEVRRILLEQHFYQIVAKGQSLLFMSILSVILVGLFAAAYEIVKEKPIFDRERLINLGIGPYLASKIFLLSMFGACQCLILLGVLLLRIDFPKEGILLSVPVEMYITLLLAMFPSICLGLLISAFVKSSNVVVYVIVVILFIQIIFSGALFDLPEAAKPLSYLTQTRWALEGLGATVDLQALNEHSQFYLADADRAVSAPFLLGINYDRNREHLVTTWIVQILFGLGFMVLTMVVLRRQDVL